MTQSRFIPAVAMATAENTQEQFMTIPQKTPEEVRACVNKIKASGKIVSLSAHAHQLMAVISTLQLGLKHPYIKFKENTLTKDFIEKLTRTISWVTDTPEVVGIINEGFREDMGQFEEATEDFLDAFAIQAICTHLLLERLYSLEPASSKTPRKVVLLEVKSAAKEIYEKNPEAVKKILNQVMPVNLPDETT